MAIVVPTSVVVVYEGKILCIFERNTSFSNTKVTFRFEIIVITGNGLHLKYIYLEQVLKRY